jgi:hypothetical protein
MSFLDWFSICIEPFTKNELLPNGLDPHMTYTLHTCSKGVQHLVPTVCRIYSNHQGIKIQKTETTVSSLRTVHFQHYWCNAPKEIDL